jgi:hypothetical protein
MTQTKPDARPLPDSEVRRLREPLDDMQDRSRREFETDPVIEFVTRTVVRNFTGTMRRNVQDNVQDAVSETVADYVSRNVPEFHNKALVRTIETGVGDNVAEFENEFDPEFDDKFAAEFVVRPVAVTLTFVRPEVSYRRETPAAAVYRDFSIRVLLRPEAAQHPSEAGG